MRMRAEQRLVSSWMLDFDLGLGLDLAVPRGLVNMRDVG